MNIPTTLKIDDLIRNKYNSATVDMLNTLLLTLPSGSHDSAIGHAVYGFNHMQTPGAIPLNKDNYGYTFFTRPNLNMTSDNLKSHRIFNPLLTNKDNTMHRALRCILDPTLSMIGAGADYHGTEPAIKSTLIDNQQAFIPILSNTLLNVSGWPDMNAMIHTSAAGSQKEESSWVDGIALPQNTYDISISLRNIPGNPVLQLIFFWMWYQSLVYMGTLMPYPYNIIMNRIDYNTRIYRLVMDEQKRYVTAICCSGASFPTHCPIGALFNYESDRPINNSNDQLSFQMHCIGIRYFDDIIIDDFNRTSGLFMPNFLDKDFRAAAFRKLMPEEKAYFNNIGYPRINPDTMELEWWVTNEQYNAMLPTALQATNFYVAGNDASLMGDSRRDGYVTVA